MAEVEHLCVDNRRIRVLTADEQRALLAACPRHHKLRMLLELLLITGARVGEFLALKWTEWVEDEVHFLHTKNGKPRRVQVTPIERKRAALETFDRILEGDAPVSARESPAKEHKASTRAVMNGDVEPESDEFAEEFWWTAGGSNSRPPRCERGALPTELAAH